MGAGKPGACVTIGSSRVELVVGDITSQDTDAVVNAANAQLAPGGGVAGAIHRAAGPGLWQECSKLGGCRTGEAKVTSGHDLPNRVVVHTVGPVYGCSGDDAALLRSSYLNSLKAAEECDVHSIAFPALSTGAFGYPVAEAARIALETIISYLKRDSGIDLVRMVLYDDNSYAVHAKALESAVERSSR